MNARRILRPLFVSVLLALLAAPAPARILSQGEIETAAANFVAFDDLARELLPGRTVASVKPRDALWIVDLDPAGYIVMSGSDAAEPVVAFGPNKMVEIDPEEPLYTLLGMASAFSEAAENPPVPTAGAEGEEEPDEIAEAAKLRRSRRWESFLKGADGPQFAATSTNYIVRPLMPQHWNQWQPYNDYCPRVTETKDGYGVYRRRAATGCVATAFAQVMGFYQWPVRMDRVLTYNNSCSSCYTNRIGYRFDGSVPLDWDDLEMEYERYNYNNWGYDLSGYTSETARYKIGRLFNLNEIICQISLGPCSTGGSSGYTTSVGNYNPWYKGTSNVSHGTSLAPALKAAMQRGEPVVVAVPSHAVVVHGYAEGNDGTQFAYINYGWRGAAGGDNDGWYDINISSGGTKDGYIQTACIGFVPFNTVQVDPLPAYSGTSVTLNWYSPAHWDSTNTGFKITASYAGDTVSDFTDDFTNPKGTLSGAATIGVVSDTGRTGPVLGFEAEGLAESDQYCTWDAVGLTSSSVLSFDYWYAKATSIATLRVQASFDGGAWTDLFTQKLSWNSSPAWTSKTVSLASYAGSAATFRAWVHTDNPGGYMFYSTGDPGVQAALDNFKVTSCKAPGDSTSVTVAKTARSYTFTGLTVGKTYSFSVTPIAANAAGSGGASTTIATAAGTLPSITQVWANTSSTNQVKEGFFRNCALSGRTVLHVQCSSNTTGLEVHSGNQSAISDAAIAIHDVGGGLYDIVFDTSLPSNADDQRLLMTLIATDEYGRTGAKDLSLRLLASVPSETYTPSTKTPPVTDGGAVTAILATTATAAVGVESFGNEGSSATVTMTLYRGTSATGTAVSTQNKSLSSPGTASFSLTGLTSGSTYTVRFVTASSNGFSVTDDVTFTTVLNKAPTIASVTPGTPSSTAAPVTVNLSAIGDGSTSVTLKVEVSTQSNFSSIAKTVTQGGVTATGPTTVTVSGLASATKYYVRVTATGSNGMSATNTSASFTTADPAMPSGSFTLGTATLNTIPVNWSVDSIGSGNSSAIVYVDYGTTTSYGTSKQASTVTGAKTGTYTITGLAPETTYHVRVRVVAGSRTFTCDDRTATTLPVGDPTVTGSFKSSTQYTAVVNYALTALGTGASSATIYLDYGTSSSYGSTATIASNATGTKSGTYTLSNLNPETTYHFRVRAVNNANKTGKTSDFTGTTTAVGTPAATVAATETMSRGAMLAVSVTSLGTAATSATVTLEYGTTTSYGSTATVSPATLTAAGTATASLSGLQSNTKYYVRATVKNNGNKTVQPTTTFTTLQPNDPVLGEPSVTTSFTSATVSVDVTMLGNGATSATGTIRWGTTAACSGGSVDIPRFTAAGTVSGSITGLAQNTTYYYTITIVNNLTGQTTTDPATFTTRSVDPLAWGEGYYEGGLLMGYKSGNGGSVSSPGTTTLASESWNTKTYARGPISSYAKFNETIRNEVDGQNYSWGNCMTYVYEGQMWFEAGKTYNFAAVFYPGEYVYLDGELLFSATTCTKVWDGSWTKLETAAVTPVTSGWKDIRIVSWSGYNGGGACGGGSGDWNTASNSPFYPLSIGLAWNTNGTATLNDAADAAKWSKLLDAGDRHLFRARGNQHEYAFLNQAPIWTKNSLTVPVGIETLVPGMTLTVYIGRRADAWYFEDRWERSATVASVPDGASVQSVTFTGIDTTTDWYVSARLSDGSKYDQWTDPVKWTPVIPAYEKPNFSVKATDGVEPMVFGGTETAPKVSITINNASADAAYGVYASDTVDGTYSRVSATQKRSGELLTFEVDATADTKFFQIKASASESDLP